MNVSFIISYLGGYLSLLGLVQRPDIFKVRIISCFNWTIWTNVKIVSIFFSSFTFESHQVFTQSLHVSPWYSE